MDARVAVEGNGPTKGKPVKMNLMLTSTDALATDMVALKIMGLSLKEATTSTTSLEEQGSAKTKFPFRACACPTYPAGSSGQE